MTQAEKEARISHLVNLKRMLEQRIVDSRAELDETEKELEGLKTPETGG